jgi:hypothetical protein
VQEPQVYRVIRKKKESFHWRHTREQGAALTHK